jgi:cell migration-inducing and hyaluronan-binding protein
MGRLNIAGDFSGFQTGPITNPIILQRNGRRFEYNGGTTIGSGAEVRVETARESLSLSLGQLDKGSFVIFEFPEFVTAAEGAERSSLAALRDASETSYYRDDEALWVKLVVADAAVDVPDGPGGPGAGGPAGGTGIEVSR